MFERHRETEEIWNRTYLFYIVTKALTIRLVNQLSVEVQQDQEMRMRVALGVYIIADRSLRIIPLSGILLGFSFYGI